MNLSIKPYDFLEMNDGSFVLVESIRKRRVAENVYLDDLIVCGKTINKENIKFEGKSTKSLININSVSNEMLFKFLNNVHIKSDIWYPIEEIKKHISRDTVFNIKV